MNQWMVKTDMLETANADASAVDAAH